MIRTRHLVTTVTLLGLTATAAIAEDPRDFRKITLDNGLRVLLVSDPDVNEGAASMAVGVGANGDPKGSAGLAHFLEHMLFLKNDKYPELNSYSNFLQSRGGGSNAYTSQDHTNYHFQVSDDALPEALDRFAQFFVSPILDWQYAEREMQAVNAEHQKNTMDDTWRLMQLQRQQIKAGHPGRGFSTGNAETLKDAKEEVLRGFFNDYYKPGNMGLAVISKRPLDELERIVRERFDPIPAGEAKPWSMSADILDPADGLRLLKVIPVKDSRQLSLYVEVPPQFPNALSHIDSLVGMTMGDEGPGSLLSYLKAKGLANSLSAGCGGTRFYSSCSITVGLTEQGLAQWETVLESCFAYFKLLRESGFPQTQWEEMKTLAELSHAYGAQPEGTGAAIAYANAIIEHGLELSDKLDITFQQPDPQAWQALVDALRPENTVAFLVAKGQDTDKHETYYGTEYSESMITGDAFKKLQDVKVPEGIHLPKPNPFVPKNTSVLPEQPVLIQKDDAVTLYYAQDTEFDRPKATIQMNILSPAVQPNPKTAALNGLLMAVLNEQLNEFAYPALMAGLGYSLSTNSKGIWISASGYSDSVFPLLSRLAKALRGDLNPETFARVKARQIDAIKNQPLGQAYQVLTEFTRELNVKDYVMPSEALPEVEAATLEAVLAQRDALLAQTHIEALCAGNLTADQARAVVAEVQGILGSKPFDPDKVEDSKVLWLGEGDDLVYKATGETDQHCLRIDYQVGKSDVKTRMAAQVIGRALSNPFFTEMRTKQKLGYIVFSGALNRRNVETLVFLVQSGSFDPDDMRQRADTFIATLPEWFAALPDEQFEAIRASLIEDREKEPKSIAEKAGEFYDSAFDKDCNFDWIQDEIAALRALDRETVNKLIAETVSPDTRRRIVYELAAKGFTFKEPGNVELGKIGEGRTYIDEDEGY